MKKIIRLICVKYIFILLSGMICVEPGAAKFTIATSKTIEDEN